MAFTGTERDQAKYNAYKLEEEKYEKITIIEFEETYPGLAKEFQQIQKEQYELFAGKMLDYGLSNISLGSNLEEKQDIHLSLTGIWLRCNDKINRLKNMLKRQGKNYVKDEPMIDSFIDISNYGIIAMLVLRDKWKK
jgi:hypothetical protein|tara:strand:+ start:4552 stop:4962 length:411 start_codon:yes stop_codon:yes gene_type:complete